MKKYLHIFIPVLTLIIGLVAGWFASAHVYNKWIESYMTSTSFVDLSDRYTVLSTLRAGDTNKASDLLESQMTGDILVFGSMIRDVPTDKRKPSDTRLLTRVRDYRTAHPFVTTDYPDVDKGVSEVFSLLNTNQLR